MPVKIRPATGAGSVALEAANGVSTDFTLTLPGTTGTVLVSNSSSQTLFPDGTVSAPSISNDGDSNTGIYFPAADTIGFVEGGVESMRLDANGNLGLGVTPSAWSGAKVLQVGNTSIANYAATNSVYGTNYYYDGANLKYISNGNATYYQQTGGLHSWFNAASGVANNNITFTQAMTLDASGRLGVGVTSLYGNLDVLTSAGRIFFLGNSGANFIGSVNAANNAFVDLQLNGATTQLFTVGVERMRIDSSGNVGIGTTSMDQKLNINGGITINNTSGTLQGKIYGTGSAFRIENTSSTPIVFIQNTGTEYARIDASGNLLVGTMSASSSRLIVQGSGTTSSTFALRIRNNTPTDVLTVRDDGYCTLPVTYGTWTTGSAANVFMGTDGGLYRSTSSLRYKHDVENAVHGLADVLALRPVTYKGINDGDKIFGGLIAEEVDAAGLTEFVVYDDDGRPDALHYGNMVSLAFKAIQELAAKNADLEARLAALESK